MIKCNPPPNLPTSKNFFTLKGKMTLELTLMVDIVVYIFSKVLTVETRLIAFGDHIDNANGDYFILFLNAFFSFLKNFKMSALS